LTAPKKYGPIRALLAWIARIQSILDFYGVVDGPTHAAAITYSTLFALFPLILALLSILGFFLESQDVQQQLAAFIADYLPPAQALIQENAAQLRELRTVSGLLALVGLLWAAKGVFGALDLALNRIWQVPSLRSLLHRTSLHLGLIFATGGLLLVSFALTTLLEVVGGTTGPFPRMAPFGAGLVRVAGLGLPVLLNGAACAGLYRFLPNTRVAWAEVWPGALFAAIAFELAKNLYILYARFFGNFEPLYGSLAAVIGFLVWLYYMVSILLLGAVICRAWTARSAGRLRGTPPLPHLLLKSGDGSGTPAA
jgi:membrane protein